MIHRQLIGLWAVLLLASSTWAQEAGEEIIAKFKQSILDRRAAIRNCRIDVKITEYRPKGSEELFPSMKGAEKDVRKNFPILNKRLSVILDRDNKNIRIIDHGETPYEKKEGGMGVATIYTENGFLNKYPVFYIPRSRNELFREQSAMDGSIYSHANQAMSMLPLGKPMPVPFALGMFPFPTHIQYPSNEYIDVDKVINPSMSFVSLTWSNEQKAYDRDQPLIRYSINDKTDHYYILTVNQQLGYAVTKITAYYSHQPRHIIDNIVYKKHNNIWMPASWRSQNYSGTPAKLTNETLYEVNNIRMNHEDNVPDAIIPVENKEVFVDASSQKQKYYNGGFIDRDSGGNIFIYVVLSIVMLIIVTVFVIMLKRKAITKLT